MYNTHVLDSKLRLYVQNRLNNYEYERLSDDEILDIKEHLQLCEICSHKFEQLKVSYEEIASIKIRNSSYSRMGIISVAAMLLICITLPFLISASTLNQTEFIQLHEFNFKIKRGLPSSNDSLNNKIIYYINEKKYSEAIELCKKLNINSENLRNFYFASLVLKGQNEDDSEMILKALDYIPEKNSNSWKRRINKIINTK